MKNFPWVSILTMIPLVTSDRNPNPSYSGTKRNSLHYVIQLACNRGLAGFEDDSDQRPPLSSPTSTSFCILSSFFLLCSGFFHRLFGAHIFPTATNNSQFAWDFPSFSAENPAFWETPQSWDNLDRWSSARAEAFSLFCSSKTV